MARLIIPTLAEAPMMLSTLMSDWLIHLARVEGYAASTIANYERTRLQFLAFLRGSGRRDEIDAFTDATCDEFMKDLGARGIGVNTIVNKLAALSSFAIYGMRARNKRGRPYFATNPTKAFKWPRTRRANVPILTPDEIAAFLTVPLTEGKAMIRDLFLDTGLRPSEIAGADVEDLLRVEDVWFLEVTVKSRGRQRRQQFPISADVGARLAAYLQHRAPLKPGAPLIVRRDGQRYSRSHLGRVLELIGQAAGIRRLRVSPYKIRHVANVWRRMGGADSLQRSAMLGHSSPRSIHSYEHIIPFELHQARAQQREGMRRYLSGVETGVCATPENEGAVSDRAGASSPVSMRAGDDRAQQGSYETRLSSRMVTSARFYRVAQVPPTSDFPTFCGCGCPSTAHDVLVSADNRLVGACAYCGPACETFESAAA